VFALKLQCVMISCLPRGPSCTVAQKFNVQPQHSQQTLSTSLSRREVQWATYGTDLGDYPSSYFSVPSKLVIRIISTEAFLNPDRILSSESLLHFVKFVFGIFSTTLVYICGLASTAIMHLRSLATIMPRPCWFFFFFFFR
jgi:hypothetical protein